ncbi:MAG: MBL fold metallo-hydrolase [Flavobacteriales bacterium]
MELTFLGTGTSLGVPVIGSKEPVSTSGDHRDKRTRTSAILEHEGVRILIDAGPDLRTQLLRENIQQLDAVLFTHEHRDHVAGIDDLRPFYFHQEKPLPLFMEQKVLDSLRWAFYYLFDDERYPTVPEMCFETIRPAPFRIEGVEVLPIRAYHHMMPVLGFRFGDLTYITDANHIDEGELAKAEGSRVLVLNALRKSPHLSHFNLEEALRMVERIAPEQAYFTHISEWMGFHEEVEAELPDNVHLAYDGLKVEL